MTAHQALDEAAIRRRIDQVVQAIRAMDLEGVQVAYAPDVVSFDVQPPLRHPGAEAKRRSWSEVFAAYRPPLGYEVRDLTVTVGGEVAFAHSLNRLSGRLKRGGNGGFWVRATYCFRKIGGDWLVVHDHVSVPLDVRSGRARLDLEP
jgi:ketosteroid isomerase-like protein